MATTTEDLANRRGGVIETAIRKTIVEDGNGPPARAGASEADCSEPFGRVFGALKGTVTIAPGTDLTAPVGEGSGAAR